MTRGACKRATELSCRRNELNEAERLELEHHLGSCQTCSRDSIDIDALIEASAVRDMPILSERARNRAIDSALRSAVPQPDSDPRGVRFWARRLWIPSVTMAAAAAVAVGYVTTTSESATRVSQAEVGSAGDELDGPSDRVLSGRLTSTAGALERHDPIVAGIALSARGDTVLTLGHARLELTDGATVRWLPESSTVALAKGSLRAAVDPAPKRGFRVTTDQFAVEVIGTEFAVDDHSVRVAKGVVRIEARDGVPLIERLEAGESWSLDVAVANPPQVAPDPSAALEPIPEPAAPSSKPTTAPLSASALLSAARSQLASRDVAAARRAIKRALRTSPNRAERAEAETLLAECHLVDGAPEAAVAQYLVVVEQFASLAAGETALFAAARLEANAGRTERAKTLLQQYLATYPTGRFVVEARKRLTRL